MSELSIPENLIREKISRLSELLKNFNFDVEGSNILGNLILKSCAVLSAYNEMFLNDKLRLLDIETIKSFPNIISESEIDRLGNVFGMVRFDGYKSFGKILVKRSENSDIVVPQGTKFSIGTEIFETIKTFNVKGNVNNVTEDNDVPSIQINASVYGFVIEVASIAKKNFLVKKGTVFSLIDTATIPNVIGIEAFEDFYPGKNRESNKEFIDRILNFFNNKSIFNEISVKNLLEKESGLNIKDIAIIGPGNNIAKRNLYWLFPINRGSAVDVCIRTNESYIEKRNLFVCTLVNKVNNSLSYWEVEITRNKVAGLFRVLKVQPFPDTTELNPLNFTYIDEIDSANNSYNYSPDIELPKHAKYSVFIKTKFKFLDDVTDVSAMNLGDKKIYLLTYLEPDNLGIISDFFYSNYNIRENNDVLLKSAIPCLVSVTCSVSGTAVPSMEIANIIKNTIDNMSMGETLSKEFLKFEIIKNLNNISVDAIDIVAKILKPDNTIQLINSDTIIIPSELDNIMSKENVFFLTDYVNVSVF